MNNNLHLISKLAARLSTIAAHGVTDLERKGYQPFLIVPEPKEDTKSQSFELKFRARTGKVFEKPELVEASIKKFREKNWGIKRDKSTVLIDLSNKLKTNPETQSNLDSEEE